MKLKITIIAFMLAALPIFSQTAEDYYNMAYQAYEAGDIESQIKYSGMAIEKFEAEARITETYFYSIAILAIGCEIKKEFDTAIELYKSAILKCDPDSESLIYLLNNLGSLFFELGMYEDAKSLLFKALEIKKRVLGENHTDYSLSLSQLGQLYSTMGDFENAVLMYAEAMEILKIKFGTDNLDYASSINNLGLQYELMGQYTKAEPFLIEAMEIRKKILGVNHPLYGNSLNNLALLYHQMGNYTKAEPLYIEALEIMKKVLSTDHPDYATSLDNLGGLYKNMGNYTKAEPLHLEALAIRKKTLGPDNPDYATSLHNLAEMYKSMGEYPKAEPLYIEALEIIKKVLGTNHPYYATSLNGLASLYSDMGNFEKAEPLFIEALKIRKKVLGPDHPEFATSLNGIASLYSDMGNFEKAEPFYLEALKIRKKVLGPDHPEYARSLNNLALLYTSMGNSRKAEPFYLEALEIMKKVLSTDHPDYATGLNNLASLYESMGNYPKAEPLHLEALKIRQKALGTDHPDYANSLHNLASLYKSIGNYLKAEFMYQEVLEITKKILGTDHPNYALSLNSLGSLYQTMGNYEDAISLRKEALAIIQKNVKATFTVLSESDKSIFSKKDDHLYEILLSTSSFIPDQVRKTIYDRLLFRKGLVLNSSVNTISFIFSSNDSTLKQKYSDWISTKQVINNLYSKTIEQRSKTGFSLDSLEELANSLEKELSRMSSTFQDFVMIPDYKWEDVRGYLKPGEAVVDLVKYRLYDKRWTDTTRYGVFITRFDSDEEPVYLEFKDGNRIDTLLIPKLSEQNRNRFADISPEAEDENVVVLNSNEDLDYYTELFAPIAHHLNGIKRIFFSLDGEFYKVNFNTLRNPETGKYLMEDYEIVYVSSANEIARGVKETSPNKSAVLTGFPNYDLSLDSLTAIIKMELGAEKSRDVYMNTSKIQKYTLDLLPGTKEEVTVTSELLKKNGWKVDSWLFNEATESKIKGLNAPGLLSISTHGFFSPSPKADYTDNYFMGSETKKAIENPLLRSGLFLTGAETFLNANETQKDNFTENGILTAYEASQLNLLGTDIVILSACETGLGEVNNGEGVFGLQRGFFGAGAKSVLMSLWKVDDTATRDLMIEFIKNYSTTMNKQKSLTDAQLTIMKKYPQPYYWGAFVMVGL